MKFHVKQRNKPVINIVSLVDVLCILLIFFIVTTVFKTEETIIKIDLPESSQAKASDEDATIIIHVTEDEKIFLGDVPLDADHFPEALKKLKSLKPSARFALKADKKAPFGLIVRVMDGAKAAGIRQLPAFTQELKKK